MTRKPHHDFETRSASNLKLAGAYRYFEHPTTSVMCMSWTMGDGLVYTWRPGEEPPGYLLQAIVDGELIGVHNATFERLGWRWLRAHGHGLWPELPIKQQDCTMARAAAHGLPQSLDQLGQVLNLPFKKDEYGYNLMLKLSSPRKVDPNGSVVWWEDPAEIDYLCYTYCPQDVRTEQAADECLPALSAHERLVWELDQKINDRGVYIDENAVTRAVDVVLHAKRRADKAMYKLTGGKVGKCSQIADLVKWIQSQGIDIDSARKGMHDEIIALAEVSGKPHVRRAIELRKEASKTSTAKYSKMLECVCADGRIRGLLNYHGAGTGRWAGRLVQPQNLPRVDPDNDGPMVEFVSNLLSAHLSIEDTLDMIEMGGYEALPALSKSLRGMICAA